jgi:predicted NUDIX family phosphoesterase
VSNTQPATTSPTPEVEQILVVPTSLFHQLGHFQGFSSDTARYLESLLSPQHTSYRPRPDMERDPSFKQLIPYVVFRYIDPAGAVHLFEYTRGKGQGEQRLHSKRSIGIGGHISAADSAHQDVYAEGMRRELEEEVEIDTTYTQSCLGLINDDLTEVGKVHLGVVHLFDVVQPRVRPREADILDAAFRPLDELLGKLAGFETWSRICLEQCELRK